VTGWAYGRRSWRADRKALEGSPLSHAAAVPLVIRLVRLKARVCVCGVQGSGVVSMSIRNIQVPAARAPACAGTEWGGHIWGFLADYLIIRRTQLGVPSCLLGFVAVLVQDYEKVVALGFLQVLHAILCMSYLYYSYDWWRHTGVW
jgi:hypothetical protein